MDMGKKHNTIKTKEKIKSAFTELIMEKGFNNLSVVDISERAGINRGTFYLHYTDKYNLLETLETTIIQNLNEILRISELSNSNYHKFVFPHDKICDALNYIKSDFAFIKAISTPNGDPKFSIRVKQLLYRNLNLNIKHHTFFNIGPHIDYSKEILVSSVASIIMLWISRNGKDAPESIATLIEKVSDISPQILAL